MYKGKLCLESLVKYVCLLATVFPMLIFFALFASLLFTGLSRFHIDFLTSFPSRMPEIAGLLPALVGTFFLVLLTAAIALPIGVGAAIYLEEYAGNNRLARMIESNVSNLAGVPSVVFGLLGLEIFVRVLGLGHSILSGALTLALLIQPMIIVASREALRIVPHLLREASLALGASKWRTIRCVVMPAALPSILTGIILSISRVVGESAPLIVIGAASYIAFLPYGVNSEFTALPVQIFNWISRPQKGFIMNAAAGIVLMLVLLLLLNAVAIIGRAKLQKKHNS